MAVMLISECNSISVDGMFGL